MPAAARVTDRTATQDPITGPGVPTVSIMGLPAAVIGDAVVGPACTGAISLGSLTVSIGGRPAARVGDTVTGVNPSGAPVTTTIAPPGAVTVNIGP